jgi:site-specific recombinase XerD
MKSGCLIAYCYTLKLVRQIGAMMKAQPRPVFDTLDHLQAQFKNCQRHDANKIITKWIRHCFLDAECNLPAYTATDYQQCLHFLYSYRGCGDTFNSYRRELERLIQWSWIIREKSIVTLKRIDIEAFIAFCQDPPKTWIGTKTVARFQAKYGQRLPNAAWRPFIVKVSKKLFSDGERPELNNFKLSQISTKQIFAILGSFFHYLVQEEMSAINPVLQIRQKSKFNRSQLSTQTIRRLSQAQWQAVINVAMSLADQHPNQHERTLFIMNALYGMYLRISELAATQHWQPMMRDFFRDVHGDWWFRTVGKGNKMRQIAVSPPMLLALKRWRKHLHLSPLPSVEEGGFLIPKVIGKGPVSSTRAIRNIVQACFDKAVANLLQEKKPEDADLLRSATVHWLRHTGISEDVKIRPREHVRDDAGHGSGAITDRYIDVELRARAKSAGKKTLS